MINKKNFLKFLVFATIFVTLMSFTMSERIIPDPNFPVIVKSPRKTTEVTETTFEFRFRLPDRTRSGINAVAGAIGYGQYIGIRF